VWTITLKNFGNEMQTGFFVAAKTRELFEIITFF
jgi:hypothetical protein